MSLSVFEHMLRTERYIPPKNRRGDFSAPVMGEFDLPSGQDPLFVTNARGDFLPTRVNRSGSARFGFSVCPIDEEAQLLRRFYERLSTHSEGVLRCTGVQMAVDRLRSSGLEAKTIVMSAVSAAEMFGKSGPMPEGHAGMVNGMNVLVADLPKGAALVAVAPALLGVYTRVVDHLGLLIQRVDRNVLVIDALAR